jgi:hypothetical protein
METIVTIDWKKIPRTSTAKLCEWFAIDHWSVIKTIKRFESDFLDLWDFEEGKDILIMDWQSKIRQKKSKVLFLNEMQVNFFWTLTNNTPESVAFKKRLVIEFDRARNILKKLIANQTGTDFIWALPEWKAIRRTLTDAIQDYNDYRVQRWLEVDKWIYSNITKLVNTQLFDFQWVETDWKINKRQLLTEKQRRKLADVEDDLVEIIIDNLEDPYKKVKEYLEMRMTHLKKSVVIDDQLRLLWNE